MRGPILSACVIAALTVGAAASASTTAPKTAPKPSAAGRVMPVANPSKRETCAMTWQAQKTHVGKRESYINACVAKG